MVCECLASPASYTQFSKPCFLTLKQPHTTCILICFHRVAGEVFAASLAQGGPAPCFLQEWCYNYLTAGELIDITKENVFDLELSTLIEKVSLFRKLPGCSLQPGPRSLSRWGCRVQQSLSLLLETQCETSVSILLQIEEAEDITPFTGEIIDCGYTGRINVENKANIIRCVCL